MQRLQNRFLLAGAQINEWLAEHVLRNCLDSLQS